MGRPPGLDLLAIERGQCMLHQPRSGEPQCWIVRIRVAADSRTGWGDLRELCLCSACATLVADGARALGFFS